MNLNFVSSTKGIFLKLSAMFVVLCIFGMSIWGRMGKMECWLGRSTSKSKGKRSPSQRSMTRINRFCFCFGPWNWFGILIERWFLKKGFSNMFQESNVPAAFAAHAGFAPHLNCGGAASGSGVHGFPPKAMPKASPQGQSWTGRKERGWMDGWMASWMDGWLWMDGWFHGWTDGFMDDLLAPNCARNVVWSTWQKGSS